MDSITSMIDEEQSSGLPNHYEVLGVDEEASDVEIKSAYFRLVRKYRPQEHPEEFQRFNDAGKVLSDPRRRGAYDEDRRNGRRMQVLVDQAAKALEKDPQKAQALLKNAIAMAPNIARPRALLAQVLVRMEEFESAEKQYHWLIRDKPLDETLRYKLARCLWLQKRFADAETAVMGALKLNARYHDALMLLSRLQEAKEEAYQSAETLERAISNDGKENYADIDALLRLLISYLVVGNEAEAVAVSHRLVSVIPADGSVLTDKAVQRILRRANELYQAENFRGARCLLDCAGARLEGLDETAEQYHTISRAVLLRKEARQLQADKLAEGALKAYLELRYLDRSPETLRQKLEVLLSRLQGEISLKPREVIVTIDYVRRQYPTIAGEQERLLTELYDRAQKRAAANAELEMKNASAAAAAEKAESEQERQKKRGILGWLRGSEK
jgi:tetratricopeptide (TPR) repeat protein